MGGPDKRVCQRLWNVKRRDYSAVDSRIARLISLGGTDARAQTIARAQFADS